MIRNLVLIFNMAAFLIYRIIFQDGGVEIKQNVPQSAKAGSDYTVELIINKGAVSGFAKFQQDLPQGMTATPIETNSGTFSFVDNAVKIIWMSLPNDKEFKVTYKVSVTKDVSGSHPIGGKFSYIDNNEKKTVNLESSTINIENPDKAASVSTQPSSQSDSTSATQPEPSSSNTQSTASTSVQATGTSGLSAGRNIPVITNPDEFTVEINVVRGNVTGFAKLEETIPAGFTATAIESNNAVFSFVDQKAKFLWMSLPSENEFKVKYKIKKEAAAPSDLTVEGLFSYLENDVTQKVVIPAQKVNLQPGAIAQSGSENARKENSATSDNSSSTQTETQTQSQPQPDNQPITQGTGNQTQTEPQNNTTQNQGLTSENTQQTQTTAPETSTSSSENQSATTDKVASPPPSAGGAGLKYRVQILAAHKPVDQSYFQNKHQLSESVNSEMHEGWHKFTIGSFTDYKEARDKRESVAQNNLPGPFVTAYNGGKRITVQEALMISNQKWIK